MSNIISLLLWVLVGVPVCFLLHELGHASMVLLLTKQKVTFQFGVRGPKRKFHFGRLTILMYLEPTTFIGARYHLENREGLSRSQDLWITIGGPLASFLFTCLFGVLWWVTHQIDPWRGLTLINLLWTTIRLENVPEGTSVTIGRGFDPDKMPGMMRFLIAGRGCEVDGHIHDGKNHRPRTRPLA